jgi:TolA-binding protein
VQIDETYQNGSALYNLGKAYQKNNDQESANQYFDKVIEKFPNTDLANYAQMNKH